MFRILENFRFATQSISTNRLRTFMTLLGIIIGVAAVIVVGSISQSGKKIVFDELETFGLKSVWLFRSYRSQKPGVTSRGGTGIDIEDVEAISKNISDISYLSPVIRIRDWVKNGSQYQRVSVYAVNSDYNIIASERLLEGRFLIKNDIRNRKSVAVITEKVAKKLFPIDKIVLGKEVRIQGVKYTIVGVLKNKDRQFLQSIGSAGSDPNVRVLIPISSYQRRFNTKAINTIHAQVSRIDLVDSASNRMKELLRRRHKNRFEYETVAMKRYIETAERILGMVSLIGSIAAGISLVVGGIGIMNIMIASVVERTREIGIRKALGANKTDILVQFLAESTLVSFFGGVLGVLMGISMVKAASILSKKAMDVSPEFIILSLVVSGVVGIISGLYPAIRAASLDPVVALRAE